MEYQTPKTGIFLRRQNRFVAEVELEGRRELVHVRNTGRCRELLLEGARVFLEEAAGEKRKTKYSLIAVEKGERLVNLDAQAPNRIAAEALAAGRLAEIGQVEAWRREVSYGSSRFDLYYRQGTQEGFLEVKGVTLEEGGIARFPDAPTERGTKHLRELMAAKAAGYQAAVLFVIQMEGVREFRPHARQDGKFALALREAAAAGVQVLAYDCKVQAGEISLDKPVPVALWQE